MQGYSIPHPDGDLTAMWFEWEDGTLRAIWLNNEDLPICYQQVAAKGQE